MVNLDCEEIPVNDASNCVATSDNVAVAENLSNFRNFSQLQFSPVDNKIKELVRPVALPELLAPLHIETRVELHNPDVLVVVRTTA